MSSNFRFLAPIVAASLLCGMNLHAQATPDSIEKRTAGLRDLSDDARPAAIKQLALDIRTLPGGREKLKYADALEHLSTEGDEGMEALQAVADTLAAALTESPAPESKSGEPAMAYFDLARLVRYEHVTTTFNDPQYVQAMKTLVDYDKEIATPDFTMYDTKGKKIKFSDLKGKVVLVNFWATWCPPCRKEMPTLDALQQYFGPQGFVVLSISAEDPRTINTYLANSNYKPEVLYDEGAKVGKMYHIQGIPRTFIYNRDGKLVAESIDMRTQKQFLRMLSRTDLHMNK